MSTALTGNFCGSVREQLKRWPQGLARIHVLHYANAPALTREETGRYDLAWKDLCSVLNALSK